MPVPKQKRITGEHGLSTSEASSPPLRLAGKNFISICGSWLKAPSGRSWNW